MSALEDIALGDGALHDPEADRWWPMATEGAPSPRAGHLSLWTGSQMFIWGGYRGSKTALRTGGLFTP